MKRSYSIILAILNPIFCGLVQATPVFAQAIDRDTSLGTVVNSANGLDFAITQGTQSGSNLFHSFRSFSVPNQGSAKFDLTGTTGILNIFSRVTGADSSNINGSIETLGGNSPNLFLMNPNGIVFGPGARLNSIGSFVGTTATGIQFKDATFSADLNQPAPLLSVNVPIGLQMGASSGNLTVNGTGNDAIFPTNNLGLAGTPGRSIALVGRNVNLNSGVVTALAGRLDVGAVQNGTVGIATTPIGFAMSYGTGLEYGDVNLAARSSLWNPDPFGNPLAGVQVVGNNITIDQSQIAVANFSSQLGADLDVKAAGTLTLKGRDPLGLTPTWITNQALVAGTGASGSIRVRAGAIQILEGAAIEAINVGLNKGGKIDIAADSILLQDGIRLTSPYRTNGIGRSSILSSNTGAGSGDDITISARSIDLKAGGSIATFVAPGATGKGGDILIKADRVNAQGTLPADLDATASGIQTATAGQGDSGDLFLQIGQLSIVNGATIGSYSFPVPGDAITQIGKAGAVNVQADTIDIVGASPLNLQSSSLASGALGSGDAGDVTVIAKHIALREGGALTSGTAAIVSPLDNPLQPKRLGNGGNIKVMADILEVSGSNVYLDVASGIGTYTFGSGNAGNAWIEADRIRLQDGGYILSSTAASGNAGTLSVVGREILLTGRNKIGQGSTIASAGATLSPSTQALYGISGLTTGNTGALKITADRLILQDGGNISVKHEGVGNAGDLKINVNALTLSRDAEIVGSTLTGKGGDALIQVQNLLLLRDRSRISVSSAGIGDGGNIKLNAGLIVGINNGDIIANANQGNGGKIQLTTDALIGMTSRRELTSGNDITASSGLGLDGTIAVQTLSLSPQTALPILNADFTDANQQIANTCANTLQNQFISTGRGGIPQGPARPIRTKQVWQDVRSSSSVTAQAQPIVPSTPPLVEASTWTIGSDRQITLIAPQNKQSPIVATCAVGRS